MGETVVGCVIIIVVVIVVVVVVVVVEVDGRIARRRR